MPDVYISRAGMENKQLDEKFKATELEELQRRFEKEKLAKDIEMEELKKQLTEEIEERKKSEEEKAKKEKEIDWDNMVLQRMVANPKLATKIRNTIGQVWKRIEQEEKLKAKAK